MTKLLPGRFSSSQFGLISKADIFKDFFDYNTDNAMILWEHMAHLIPAIQLYRYLEKWADKGIMEYGTSPRSGWLLMHNIAKYPDYFNLFLETCTTDKRYQQFRYRPDRIDEFTEYIKHKYQREEV